MIPKFNLFENVEQSKAYLKVNDISETDWVYKLVELDGLGMPIVYADESSNLTISEKGEKPKGGVMGTRMVKNESVITRYDRFIGLL